MQLFMLPPSFFFFNDTATTEIYTLSLHDALPISLSDYTKHLEFEVVGSARFGFVPRSEEHTSELQSLRHLVCRLLLEKKKQADRETQIRVISAPSKHAGRSVRCVAFSGVFSRTD